ncbi:MAG: hypothetical protein EPO42_01115 [Gallionellaceae bacterium]|nr:MAG: hypothetical protein EPO42_01115 [Gallionellaceae bacterium]
MKLQPDDALQENIRRTASAHALRQIHAIVEEERKTEERVGRVLHAFLLYGWVVLLLLGGIVAHFMGVI